MQDVEDMGERTETSELSRLSSPMSKADAEKIRAALHTAIDNAFDGLTVGVAHDGQEYIVNTIDLSTKREFLRLGLNEGYAFVPTTWTQVLRIEPTVKDIEDSIALAREEAKNRAELHMKLGQAQGALDKLKEP